MSGYQRMIREATGCTEADAPVIEDLMRVESPTLDHLTRAEFDELAKRAAVTLAMEPGLADKTRGES